MTRRTTEPTVTERASLLLAQAMQTAGIGATELGRQCEISQQRVSRMADPLHTAALNLKHILRMERPVRLALLALLAEADGHRVVPAEQATELHDDVVALAEITGRLAAILRLEAEAQRDGLYDRGESSPLREAYADVVQLGMERIARMEQVDGAGVDAVRTGLRALDGGK